MQIDGVERHLVHHGQLHHHHPGDPEEEDIRPGHKDRGGEVFGQLRRGFWPAQGADRPKARGEPSVENVGVARQCLARRHGLSFSLIRRTVMVALGVIPHRNLVPPPQLAGNAPRLDILQPMVIGLLARLRDDLGRPRPHRLQRGFHDLCGVDEPLVSQHRLNHDL